MTGFCDETFQAHSIYAFLHRQRNWLFPTRPSPTSPRTQAGGSVRPAVVAVIMVLQRLEGLSDREAVERYCFDTAGHYAAGVGDYDPEG